MLDIGCPLGFVNFALLVFWDKLKALVCNVWNALEKSIKLFSKTGLFVDETFNWLAFVCKSILGDEL